VWRALRITVLSTVPVVGATTAAEILWQNAP